GRGARATPRSECGTEGAYNEVLVRIGVLCRDPLTMRLEQDPGLVAAKQLGSQLQAQRGSETVEPAPQVGGAGGDLHAGEEGWARHAAASIGGPSRPPLLEPISPARQPRRGGNR